VKLSQEQQRARLSNPHNPNRKRRITNGRGITTDHPQNGFAKTETKDKIEWKTQN
jgi:hypothetical protein